MTLNNIRKVSFRGSFEREKKPQHEPGNSNCAYRQSMIRSRSPTSNKDCQLHLVIDDGILTTAFEIITHTRWVGGIDRKYTWEFARQYSRDCLTDPWWRAVRTVDRGPWSERWSRPATGSGGTGGPAGGSGPFSSAPFRCR